MLIVTKVLYIERLQNLPGIIADFWRFLRGVHAPHIDRAGAYIRNTKITTLSCFFFRIFEEPL